MNDPKKQVFDARNLPRGGPGIQADASRLGMTVQEYADYLVKVHKTPDPEDEEDNNEDE